MLKDPFGREIMTVKEVSDYFQIHEQTVYKLANSGKLRGAFKVGFLWRFVREKIEGGNEKD